MVLLYENAHRPAASDGTGEGGKLGKPTVNGIIPKLNKVFAEGGDEGNMLLKISKLITEYSNPVDLTKRVYPSGDVRLSPVNDMAGLDITETKNKVHQLTRDIAHNTTMDNEDILSRINKIFTPSLLTPAKDNDN